MDLEAIVSELHRRRDHLNEAIDHLMRAEHPELDTNIIVAPGPFAQHSFNRKVRPPVSAATKAKITAAMKKLWARRRAMSQISEAIRRTNAKRTEADTNRRQDQ